MERSRNSSDSQTVLTRCVLVVRNELDQARLVRPDWLTSWRDDFKVCRERSLGRKRADLPGGCLTDTDLGLADTLRFFVGRDDVSDDSRDLELFGGLELARPKAEREPLTKTSKVPLKPIFKYPWSSLPSVRKKLCLKMAVMNESEMIMNPFVAFVSDFISSRPTWSRHPA